MRGLPRLALLGCLLTRMMARTDSAGAEDVTPGAFASNVRTGWNVPSVAAAMQGAARRLARPECAQVLSDFAGPSGRTLAEELGRLGLSAQDYLGLVIFYDGDGHRPCRNRRVLAFTSPGNRIVRVCPQFAEVHRRDRAHAELIVIHEVLHSLGLGENPPSSRAINETVRERCFR